MDMILLWQKLKVGLLIGMLYSAFFLIRSTQALKRIEITRFNWGVKS